MTTQTNVVTPERFAKGLGYKEWLSKLDINVDKFDKNYAEFQLKPEDTKFFIDASKKPNGPAKILALGEGWCPDVIRGMPMIAKLAEQTGLELRTFFRDQNLDIMNQFLFKGEFQSIPVFVFYTKDLKYICHWIERAESTVAEYAEVRAKLGADRSKFGEITMPRWEHYRQESIREMKELISKHVA